MCQLFAFGWTSFRFGFRLALCFGFVSGLLAVFSLSVEVVLVLCVLVAAAVEFAAEPEFELAPVLEPAALSFL